LISNSIACSNTGSASVTPGGGNTPYTYLWSDNSSQTTATATGLSGGSYTVTVTDNNGCSATASITITQAPSVTASTTLISNSIACSNTGSASVTPGGGNTPYTYLWSDNSSQTSASATGLSGGSYTVTVTDNNGCSATASITITQAPSVTASASTSTNVSCNAGNNGSGSVTAGGGNTPYTYLWDDANTTTTATVSNLSAGTYTVLVTDNNGCSATGSITITQPTSVLNITLASQTTAPCPGTGSATFNPATGGTAPYTYLWSSVGGTNLSTTGLSAGTYTITATDNHGCTATATVTIIQSSCLTVTASVVNNVSCNGNSNGSALANPVGGATPYTFLWSNAETTNPATGLSAGTYTVTVWDNNNFSQSATVTITQPPVLVANASATKNISCNSASTGSAIAISSGGTAPYTYLWSDASTTTTASVSNLSAGTYSVTVTDANGCSVTTTTTITQPIALSAGAGAIVNVSCNGGNNGRATVTATGGTTPYTYSWVNASHVVIATSQSTPAILTAGSYTVTVTDSCGASVTASALIIQPNAVRDSITSITEVGCNGGNGGSASVGAKGGTYPYSYLWTPGGSTLSTASGLSAGTYTVLVTDKNGCTFSNTVTATITQPAAIRDSAASITYPLCNGGTGNATIGVKGGTSPYTYNWTRGLSTTATATGLSVGTYTVTIKDKNGCTGVIATVIITQPNAIRDSIVKASTVNVTCNGSNTGRATLGVKYGASPFTYNWTPSGQTTATATGLSAGTYTVSVTDKNGCLGVTTSVTITQPYAISDSIVTASTVNETCFGGSTGSATVGVKYGVSPFTYHWTPSGKTTATATGLSAGTYSVTVADNKGCSGITAIVTITQPYEIRDTIITASTVNVTCNGGATGSAAVGVKYGVSPYTYSWTPGGQTTAAITGLSAGTYSVTVSDKNGCSGTTAIVVITQPNAIRDSIKSGVVNVTCNGGATGSATVGVKNGTAPYTYTWTPNVSTTATANGLSAGTYSVTITDNKGCTGILATVTITQPTAVRDSVSSLTNISCNGGTGSASIGVTGGVSPYTYLWTPTGKTTATVTNLTAGTYTVTVKDKNGCSNTLSLTITQPSAIRDSLVSLTEPSCNSNLGSAVIGVAGGTTPYTYTWTSNVSSTNSANNLTVGSYTVTIADNHGCSKTISLTISQPNALRDSLVTAHCGSILCKGSNDGYVTVGVKGGTTPYTYTWTPNVSSTSSATNLSAGTYSVLVTDKNGCIGSYAVYTVTQPAYMLIDSVSVLDNIGCHGGNGGEISIGTRGGTTPYTYHWSNGKTTYTISSLSAGTYTATITDNHGCSNTLSVTVTQPATALNLSLASLSEPYCHSGDGTAIVSATGGTPSYTYTWSPNVSTTDSASVTAGTYTVTVSDAHGCNATLKVVVTQPVAIHDTMVSSLKENVSCKGAQNGSATVGVKYGTAPYTYLWAPNGATTATVTGLGAGVYTVTVTDANGCTSSAATTTITAPSARLYDSISKYTCTSNTITATLGTKGGTAPYTYLWNPGGGTRQQMTGLTPGTYTITVTDAHGCSYVFAQNLICSAAPPPHDAPSDDTATTVKCCGGLDEIGLYPNPNTGEFTLSKLEKGMIIQMFDYTGRRLETYTATNATMQINISTQPNGIYLVRILDENGNLVSQKKVVKTQ